MVLNSSHFCSVSLSVLEQLLSDDHLVIDEMILFQKVCEYIRNRSDVVDAIKIKHLMSLIRFGCISLKEIVEKVKPSGLLTNEQYIFALEVRREKEAETEEERNIKKLTFALHHSE